MEATNFLIFSLLTLTLTSKPTLSLSLRPQHDNPSFDSHIALFGDAEIINRGSSIQLTRPIASSSGLLLNTRPIKFLKQTSFSTDFSFSISPHSGDGLALVIIPTSFPRKFSTKSNSFFGIPRKSNFFAIEFDTSRDESVGDENANHIGIDVRSFVSARVRNVSSLNLTLNSGVKLRSWVDYEASSKRLEIRLSEMDNARPYNPLISFPIDLSEMWKGEDVFVGISSSSGNSEQTSSVYSWKFRVRVVPHWMHSQPLDPLLYADKGSEQRKKHKKSSCPLTFVSGLMLVIACGALVAFTMQFLWTTMVHNMQNVISSEYLKHPVDLGYQKSNEVVERYCGESFTMLGFGTAPSLQNPCNETLPSDVQSSL